MRCPPGLEAYYEEIYAIEHNWQCRLAGQERVIGSSGWDGTLNKLAEIDDRHGVLPDDPRAYSIQSFIMELNDLKREWMKLKQDKCWTVQDSSGPLSSDFWEAECRFYAKLDDCRARHFAGMDSLHDQTIDTIPKLWAHITQHLIVVAELFGTTSRYPELSTGHPTQEDVQRVYSLMHRLKIAGAPPPPYPALKQFEAIDELHRIANLLEEQDLRRSAPFFASSTFDESATDPRNSVAAAQTVRAILEGASENGPMSRITFGELYRTIESDEHAYQANMKIAHKYEAQGHPASLWWRIQAGALRYHPDGDQKAALEELEVICNSEWGSRPTSENLRRLRGRLCLEGGLGLAAVDAMAVTDVVEMWRKLDRRPGRTAERDGNEQRPLAIWKAKLEHLQREDAICSNAAQKFELDQQIKTAKNKVRELGG